MIQARMEGLSDFEDLKSNAVPRAIAAGMKLAGERFIKIRLPDRFKAGARGRYGWGPRTRLYSLRKAKKKGHQTDMVWTGRMRDDVLNKSAAKVSRRSLRLRIIVAVPSYADIRFKRSGISIRREIATTIQADAFFFNDAATAETVRLLTEDPSYRVKRKRAPRT